MKNVAEKLCHQPSVPAWHSALSSMPIFVQLCFLPIISFPSALLSAACPLPLFSAQCLNTGIKEQGEWENHKYIWSLQPSTGLSGCLSQLGEGLACCSPPALCCSTHGINHSSAQLSTKAAFWTVRSLLSMASEIGEALYQGLSILFTPRVM